MLEIQLLREQQERVMAGLRKRGWSDERLALIHQIIALDDDRKATQTELDKCLNERNTLSAEIGGLFKQGRADEANSLKIKVQDVKERVDSLEQSLQQVK